MNFVDGASLETVETVPNVREVHTKFGYTIKLERRNPHGLIHVVWHNGRTPEELSGTYTSFDRAKEALALYLNRETHDTVTDVPGFRAEPIKTKRVKEAA